MKKFLDHLKKEWYKYGLETLVVIVGVLIAFSLNNWNEANRTRAKAKTYKQKLISDLVLDTIQINSLLSGAYELREGIEQYFKYFDSGSSSLEELIDSSKNVQTNFFRYFPANFTFRDMQASGNTTLLTEEEREALMALSDSQNFLTIIIDKVITDIKEAQYERNKYLDFDLSDSDFYDKVSWNQDINSKTSGTVTTSPCIDGLS